MRSYDETTLQSVVSLQVLLGMADSVSGDVRQSLWACHVEPSGDVWLQSKVRMIALKKFVWLLSKTSFVLN